MWRGRDAKKRILAHIANVVLLENLEHRRRMIGVHESSSLSTSAQPNDVSTRVFFHPRCYIIHLFSIVIIVIVILLLLLNYMHAPPLATQCYQKVLFLVGGGKREKSREGKKER